MTDIRTKVRVIGATNTLLDGARALADWMLAENAEVESLDFDDRQQLMAALRSLVAARRAELIAKGIRI